jgi:hypothetical protein
MDFETLQEYERNGLIKSRKHETLNLYIWNYTDHTMFKNKWDDVTLACRSLVTDESGNIVARAFHKFANYNKSMITSLSDEYVVYKKYDGSLILVFWYNNEWIIASKGSFHSLHVALAKALLKTDYMDCEVTYVFELIHPSTRVIVNYYSTSELILLTSYRGDSEDPDVELPGYKKAETIEKQTFDLLKGKNVPNEEGYVVRFADGTRIKIKFESYLYLHKMKSKITKYDLGDLYAQGLTLEQAIDNVPDEFHSELETIWKKFDDLDKHIQDLFKKHYNEDKKAFVMSVKNNPYATILIRMYVNLSYKDLLKKFIT